MDPTDMALAVDACVFRPPSERNVAARLYAVTLDPVTGAPVERLLEKGDARRILRRTRIPVGLDALAIAASVWRAPMEEDGSMIARPSEHPGRQRAHATVLVSGNGELVTVMRTASADPDGSLLVMHGGEGVCNDLLRACWLRRRCAQRQ